jgi:molecular chaperone Hsp33
MMETPPPANSNEVLANMALPFMIESSGIRGRFIRLNAELHRILSGHRYPACVSQLLGELLVLVSMLGSMLKLEGMLSIQIQSDGAVNFLSADCTSEGHLRSYAKIKDRKAISSLKVKERKYHNISKLLGKGYVVITIESKNEKPYQAIVPLEGSSLSHCITDYFRQSDQLDAAIEVAAYKSGKVWHAGGIVLQRIPSEGGKPARKKATSDDLAWESACTLLKSVTDKELVNQKLPPNTLLFRLFHEDGVRVFDPQKLKAQCRCSRDKIVRILHTLSAEERTDMTINGLITVTCHFCNKTEIFKDGEW